MADEIKSSPPSGGGGGKASNKLAAFVKKNKALSAVLGLGGVYFLFKSLGGGTEGTAEGESEVVSGSYEGPTYPTSELSQEGVNGEINRIDEQIRELEDREIERETGKEHIDEKETPVGEPAVEVPATDVSPGKGGITVQGKFFAGATAQRIANKGESDGGKKWIEYVISFPGRQERWQFFTASGNWRRVNNSATGPGANKPGDTPRPQPGQQGGKPNGNPQPKPKQNPKSRPGLDNKKKVAPPNPGHGGGGGGGGGSAPTCPAGTANNIRHARNEMNRLQGEINSLNQQISQYPKAQARSGWISNRDHKQGERDRWKQVIENGQRQPGCAGV